MRACAYVWTCVCVRMYTHIHLRTRMHTYSKYSYGCIYIYSHLRINVYGNVFAHKDTCTHTEAHTKAKTKAQTLDTGTDTHHRIPQQAERSNSPIFFGAKDAPVEAYSQQGTTKRPRQHAAWQEGFSVSCPAHFQAWTPGSTIHRAA
jgi:hypothetical protein